MNLFLKFKIMRSRKRLLNAIANTLIGRNNEHVFLCIDKFLLLFLHMILMNVFSWLIKNLEGTIIHIDICLMMHGPKLPFMVLPNGFISQTVHIYSLSPFITNGRTSTQSNFIFIFLFILCKLEILCLIYIYLIKGAN